MERFVSSRNGFAFTNSWPSQPALRVRTPLGTIGIGNAAGGLCGGMVYAALDFWHAGRTPPATRPPLGDPLYRYLVWRLVGSWRVPVGLARYYRWMRLPDADRPRAPLGLPLGLRRGIVWRTTVDQWPAIARDLDEGTPAALGVVTVASRWPAALPLNHQVLAYGYESSGTRVTVRVYDPNRGPRDDIVIRFDTGTPGFTHNLGIARPVRGFFRTPYRHRTPPR